MLASPPAEVCGSPPTRMFPPKLFLQALHPWVPLPRSLPSPSSSSSSSLSLSSPSLPFGVGRAKSRPDDGMRAKWSRDRDGHGRKGGASGQRAGPKASLMRVNELQTDAGAPWRHIRGA